MKKETKKNTRVTRGHKKHADLLKGAAIIDAFYDESIMDEYDEPMLVFIIRTPKKKTLACYVQSDAEGNGPGFLEIIRIPDNYKTSQQHT